MPGCVERLMAFYQRRRAAEMNPRFRLLDLPIELVILVASFTDSRGDYMRLKSTCRLLHESLELPSRTAPNNYRQVVAHRLQAGWLDDWYCSHCGKFHKVRQRDTPSDFHATYQEPGCQGLYMFQRYCTPLWSYTLCHRHVITALKYSAAVKEHNGKGLTYKQWDHMRRLLAPHHTLAFVSAASVRDFYAAQENMYPTVDYFHSVYPKIVNNRFLLLSLWLYRGPANRMRELRQFCICKHQCVNPQMTEKFRRRHGHREIPEEERPTYDDLADTSVPVRPLDDDYWFTRLSSAHDDALAAEGYEARGSCPFCPTDFAVKMLMDRRLIFCAWQDMGSLTVHDNDPAYKVFVWEEEGPERVWHPEGSIRNLYHHLERQVDLRMMALDMELFGPGWLVRRKTWLNGTRAEGRGWQQSYFDRFDNWAGWQEWLQDPDSAAAAIRLLRLGN